MTGEPAEAIVQEARFIARYDEAMVRRAVRTFMWRRVFRTVWFVTAVTGSAALAYAGLVPPKGRLAMEAGVFLLLLIAGFTILVWRAHLESSLGRLRAMSPPEAEVIVSPSRLTFHSSLGEGAVAWSTYTETWRLHGFWMLFTSPSGFNILPLEGVDPATLDLLAQRLPTKPRPPLRTRGA